jgi:dihydrofolate synthase/folylpolyglutamate synthase
MLKSYQELEKKLNNLIGEVKFTPNSNLKLERITQLLAILGNPQSKFPSIHVGGTSGKGSTSVTIASILKEAGYKTGLHTSPYLQIINEGFQINGQMTSATKLLKILNKITPAIEEVAKTNPFGKPSYFETKVAIAFSLFAEEQVDVAVIEVGLGGKLDATNVLQSQVAVLTNVGLDHTEILGDTIEKIITDKAEIIKKNQIVISGVLQPSAQKIVSNKTKKVNAKLLQLGKDFYVNEKLVTGMSGHFQKVNATCAIQAAQAFTKNKLTKKQIELGVKKAKLIGRMEIVKKNPLVILDGAHNPDKMKALTTSLKTAYPNKKWLTVVAFKGDKDADKMLTMLGENSNTIIATEFKGNPMWDSYQAEELIKKIKNLKLKTKTFIEKEPLQAVEKALKISKNDTEAIILVTGSLYLIGNTRFYWYPMEKLIKN